MEQSPKQSPAAVVEQAMKPWPLCGYAPGNYLCKCLTCDKQFEGDKRAWNCLECAVIRSKRASTIVPVAVEPVADLIERLEDWPSYLPMREFCREAIPDIEAAAASLSQLSTKLAEARAEEREACAKAICSGCATDVDINEFGFHQQGTFTFPCHAEPIRARAVKGAGQS